MPTSFNITVDIAGYGGANCATGADAFTGTVEGAVEEEAASFTFTASVPDDRRPDEPWCRLRWAFKNFTVERMMQAPQLVMRGKALGAYAAAISVSLESDEMDGIIALKDKPWVSALVQPLPAKNGSRLLHFPSSKPSSAVAFAFAVNGVVFRDNSEDDIKGVQFLSTLGKGVTVSKAELAPAGAAMFASGRGHLAVEVTVAKSFNYHRVTKYAPTSPFNTASAVFAVVGSLLTALMMMMNGVEGRQDPSGDIKLVNLPPGTTLAVEKAPGGRPMGQENDGEGDVELSNLPNAPNVPQDGSGQDIEEEWQRPEQRQQTTTSHKQSIHDLK